MATRSVSVKLSLEVAAYLAAARRAERETKDLREEVERLEKAGSTMSRAGLISTLAGVPGVASAAASGIGLIPAAALSGAAAISTLAVATNGVGDAMSAVADGDAAALVEAMGKLTTEAQDFIREYQRVKPLLDQVGDSTQSAFFEQLSGDLQRLTTVYVPTLLRQMPQLATATARIGSDFVGWATAPATVGKVNRQFQLAVDLTDDLSRLLRSGTGLLLDLADAGATFTRDTVEGLADGTAALERWVATARTSGQLAQIFENGSRILQKFGELAGQAGLLLADLVDNPALVDGAVALADVLGLTLDVVHGLLQAFELLPGGAQTAIVTLAVFGGAILTVSGRVVALKAALDRMKVSAVQAGTAVKGVGAMLGGPWGIALSAAVVVLGAFTSAQAEAKAAADGLRGTLDQQTGAVTAATREQLVNLLQQNGAIDLAKELKLNLNELTDAVLAGEQATLAYFRAEKAAADARGENSAAWSPLITRLAEGYDAIDQAKTGWQDYQNAMGNAGAATSGTTAKINAQINAIETLGETLRAQTDPAFALIKAQREMTTAQADYDKAVKEHGANSQQARDASLRLAESSIVLADAVGKASTVFNGQLTPELYATLKAAGLSEKQISDVEKAFRTAADAGDEFAGDYTANIHAQTAAAQKAIQDTITKVLQLKDKTIRISAQVYWTSNGDLKVPGGTLLRRWGGITEHAQTGLLRDAAIYSAVPAGARYAFAEPQTGGEAFVPKYGDYGRSMAILTEAARWYRASVVPWEGGGSSGGGSSYSTAYNIYPQRANFGVSELRALQAERDAYDRVGRPR